MRTNLSPLTTTKVIKVCKDYIMGEEQKAKTTYSLKLPPFLIYSQPPIIMEIQRTKQQYVSKDALNHNNLNCDL
jgi:hypothetical protein